MKKYSVFFLLTVFVVLFSTINQSFAQSIYFCEGVDDDGQPINESDTFTIPSGGGYLYALVHLPYEVDCDFVNIDVYRNGNYETTIGMDTEYNWTWFWKQITFYKSGDFDIEVYDCDDNFLVSGSLRINSR